jgi:hypothetical protein
MVRFLTLVDLLFDKQKCKTVLLTFNDNRPFIININYMKSTYKEKN